MERIKEKIRTIKMILLDVDGVMTDGGIILGPGSVELKKFHTHDGMGITLAKAAGLLVGILSGRDSEIVTKRAKELGIDEVQQGLFNKKEGYLTVLKRYRLRDEEIAYMGDDILDIPILERVGFSVCVADGAEEAKKVSHYITKRKGGDGAVREVVEMLLKGLNKKEAALTSVFQRSKERKRKIKKVNKDG
jgi:3-deoxy-D-manno-octulosonate 8-phosphate phosphatase (KDO 8-P phosphatase)